MADAYIYDAVRTPRGKGRKDGSLHEIPPIELATQVLHTAQRSGVAMPELSALMAAARVEAMAPAR